MAAYLRNPALSEETYKHLIDYGITNHADHIVTFTIPVRFLTAIKSYIHERQLAVMTDATRNKNYARLTVWIPVASRGEGASHENSSSL